MKMITAAAALYFLVFIVTAIHRWMRGGQWTYTPSAFPGRIILSVLGITILPLGIILMMTHTVKPGICWPILFAYTFLDVSYCFWRREFEYRHGYRTV